MIGLLLERDLDGAGPSAHDDEGRKRWARWNVVDDAGRRVGLVVEDREWLGGDYGPSRYAAAHNPTGDPYGALWRTEGHETAAQALAALADHLARGTPRG